MEMGLEVKKIFFPTDLSKHARFAYEFASNIAERYGASIAILHVIQNFPGTMERIVYSGLLDKRKWEEIRKGNEAGAKKLLIGKKREKVMMEQALERFRQEVNADNPENHRIVDEILVTEGNIADEIIKHTEATRSDLIVMPYHARNMIAELMRDGIVRKVLRRSKKPVLLVPMPEDR
jgi:nucleotide-binding universal stress UspA family protein